MAGLKGALFALSRVVFVAYSSRMTAVDLGEAELAASSEGRSAATRPLTAEALLEGASPRNGKRTPTWQLLKLLPVLVGVSPLADETTFLHDVRRGSWSPTSVSEAFPAEAPAMARSPPADVMGRPWAQAASQHDLGLLPKRALPAALAVRGGAVPPGGEVEERGAARHETKRGGSRLGGHGPPDWDAPGSGARLWDARVVPRSAGGPSAEKDLAEFQDVLLQDPWVSITEAPEQLWGFEFAVVRHLGFVVEISYADVEDPWRKQGAQIVMLSPKIVLGRFRGFEGTDGLVRYRFSDSGATIRIDIDHPADGLSEHNFFLFASTEVNEFVEPAASTLPTKELQSAFRSNLLRMAWPIIPMAQDIVKFAEQPGDWYGQVDLGTGDEAQTVNWRVTFRQRVSKLVSVIEIRSEVGEARHAVTLQPYFLNGSFQGMFGKHDNGPDGLVAEYLFQAQDGRMLLWVHHHMDAVLGEDLMLKFHIPLVLIPEDFF